MKQISATEAARRFSDILDAVETRRETFLVTRAGREVARIGPVAAATGEAAKRLLRASKVDPSWRSELAQLRAGLVAEDRSWRG